MKVLVKLMMRMKLTPVIQQYIYIYNYTGDYAQLTNHAVKKGIAKVSYNRRSDDTMRRLREDYGGPVS